MHFHIIIVDTHLLYSFPTIDQVAEHQTPWMERARSDSCGVRQTAVQQTPTTRQTTRTKTRDQARIPCYRQLDVEMAGACE
jgi:hypothetical protein